MRVGDLIEMLQQFPAEMRLAFVVESIDGDCASDDIEVGRREDVVELKLSGALVKNLIEGGEKDLMPRTRSGSGLL